MYTIHKWSETFENSDTRKRQRLGWVLFPSGCDSIGYIDLMEYGSAGVAAFGTFASICQWSATSCRDVRGRLARSDGSEMTHKQIAAVIRQPIAVVDRSIEILVAIGWLSVENAELIDDLPVSADDLPVLASDLPVSAGSIPKIPRLLKEKEKEKEKESFALFWAAYPEKKAKADAFKAWGVAIKKETAAMITAAVGEYIKYKPPLINYKHPATWLNKECWTDEYYKTVSATNEAGHPIDDWDEVQQIVHDVYHPDLKNWAQVELLLTPQQYAAVAIAGFLSVCDCNQWDKKTPAAYRKARAANGC